MDAPPMWTTEDTFPLEIWDMTMDHMDLETLFTMSLVSSEMKALADVKMFKLKSAIEGKFVNIDEGQIYDDIEGRVLTMTTLNMKMDENSDLVCNIERAYIIWTCVVQRQVVATIKLSPVVQKLPEALDDTKVDQIVDVKFNMGKSDENSSKLEMSWSESSKIKLELNKYDGSLVRTVQHGITEVTTTFTQVPDNWLQLVRDEAGFVSRLNDTNIKFRVSRRKVVEMKQLMKRLYDAILRDPLLDDLASPLLGRVYPCKALEVGLVDVRVLEIDTFGANIEVDHQNLFQYFFESMPAGGVVMNKGEEVLMCDRDGTVYVEYLVVNTYPPSACLVDSTEQLRLMED